MSESTETIFEYTVQSKRHMNNRVDKGRAKVTYRLKFSNFIMQGTSMDILDVILKFRYKPTSNNDFID